MKDKHYRKVWTVDADEIKTNSEFDESILYRTRAIDEFIDGKHSNIFVLVASKGYGKTFLLKAKRFNLSANLKGCLFIPENQMIDKPINSGVLDKSMVSLFADSIDNWKELWSMAIMTASLKACGEVDTRDLDDKLTAVFKKKNLNTVIDHFQSYLYMSRDEFFKCKNDANINLVPLYRLINRQVAIFIDGIDEYFLKHLESHASSSSIGEVASNIWYYSQIGLVAAIYELHRINAQVKIYASIRKEAYKRIFHETQMAHQYTGCCLDIEYSQSDLEKIFTINIKQMNKTELTLPDLLGEQPVSAFTGASEISHHFTKETELPFEYIYRHTFGKPRDFMEIGKLIARHEPTQRGSEIVKRDCHEAASKILSTYLNQICGLTDWIEINTLLPLLSSNVLTPTELSRISKNYTRKMKQAGHTQKITNPFNVLYNSGLLGIIIADPCSEGKVQQFLSPGENADRLDDKIPTSEAYLVHPILTDRICKTNSNYVDKINKTNIVGNGRIWRKAGTRVHKKNLCILKADIKGFSRLMEQGYAKELPETLKKITHKHAAECFYKEASKGDELIVIDKDGAQLVIVATRILEELSMHQAQPKLRVAIHYGEVEYEMASDGSVNNIFGSSLRVSARIEPHVIPNQIWVSEDFQRLYDNRLGLYHLAPIDPETNIELPYLNGEFNIKKKGSPEDDFWMKLYTVTRC